MMNVRQKIEGQFVVIILIFFILSLIFPGLFAAFKSCFSLGLGIIIFSIGLNTPKSYLRSVLARPKAMISLVLIRYMVMPLMAYFIANAFNLTVGETIGLIVLGTAPGGTAANVMAYLARSNVAITVLLTVGSTIVSPFLTPTFVYWFLYQAVKIDFWAMMLHISSIIFLPIMAGLVLNGCKGRGIEQVKIWMPVVSIFIIALLVAGICSINQAAILNVPMTVIYAVICLNISGYILGAVAAYALKWDKACILGVSFDYGMFDCIVAIVVCTSFFSKETAIPAVLMGVTQSLTGPLLSRYFRSPLVLIRPNEVFIENQGK